MKMRVLLTRSGEGAEALAQTLRRRNFSVVHQPLLRFERQNSGQPIPRVQAVVFTSANGARFLAQSTTQRPRAFAIGEASAKAAKKYGFRDVRQAQGDLPSLVQCIQESLPKRSLLLHPRGKHLAGNLKGALSRAGFQVIDPILYQAHASEALSAHVRKEITDHRIAVITLFSPRSAEIFLEKTASIQESLSACFLVAFGSKVHDIASRVRWKKILTPAQTTRSALIQSLANLQSSV